MAHLSDTDFEIFDLPCQFALNKQALTAAYLRLQNQTHPDRFANASTQDKRLAVQWSTRINEAYKRLQNPTERAIYWCELQGMKPREHQGNLPPALLMQQMQWRESLEDLKTADEIEKLLAQVASEKKHCLQLVGDQIDQSQDAQAANGTVQALLFVEKFLHELNKKLEQLEDAN